MKIAVILVLLFFSPYAFAKTDNDSAGTINAITGKEFVITLDANATTGYEWQLADPVDESLIELLGSEYMPDKTDLVGVGGKSIWTFKAIRGGNTRVSFKYVRSWEKGIPPVKTMTYAVNIKGPDKAPEPPDMIDQPYSAHWSDEDVGWGEESQNE